LAVVALRARAEAERQQVEAEGLVEFMMTDLRTRLRARVGRLDVMQAVNERALAHYESQNDLSSLTQEALARRARVLHAVSEDDVAQGNLAGALAAIRIAYRTTAAQLTRAPNDSERLYYHAQSEYWLGRVAELHSDWPKAQRLYARYAEAAGRLIALAPNDPRSMMEVAYSAENLGTVQLNGSRNMAAARGLYERAAHWFGRAARASPRDIAAPLAQANAYAWLADSYFGDRLWQQSLDRRTQQYQIVSRLRTVDPDNVEVLLQLASARNGMGRSLSLMNRPREAFPLFVEAQSLLIGLTQRDPGNGEWVYLRANVECALYFAPDTPSGSVRSGLAQSIRDGARALDDRHDPRRPNLQHCLDFLH
jgi:tetratricopeptide (TPR) repeat protein